MAYITKQELGSSIYGYQIEQITEGNDDIIHLAIEAATDEVRSYLTGNNQKEWLDGRLIYDVDKIFAPTNQQRNALIMGIVKTITKWWIVELCNADIIYEQAKDRYDRAVKYLKQLAKGDITLKTLPIKQNSNPNGKPSNEKKPFHFGSRTKFKHE